MFTRKYSNRNLTAVLTGAAAVALVVWTGLAAPWQASGNSPQEERTQAELQAEQALADAHADAAEAGTAGGEEALPGGGPDDEFVPGEILVGFIPGLPAMQADAVRQGVAATKIKEFARIGV